MFLAYYADVGQNGGDLIERIQLLPDKVLEGEVWRLVTYLVSPPSTNIIFALIFWNLFFVMGTTLEAVWGPFRFNVYMLIGYLASLAFTFGAYFAIGDIGFSMSASNWFLEGAVFLAFARLYPDFTVLIYFVLPVKIRWLALIYWGIFGLTMIVGPWMVRAMALSSVASYLVFFGKDVWQDVKYGQRRMRFQSRALRGPQKLVHSCRVCGITSEQATQMQFRYCSKCYGEACYCQDHLRDHEHVPAPATVASGGEGKS
jgi:hypothetical protein